MLAKKFALGFGIAIILPMMVHYGVSTFSPRPKWSEYYGPGYYRDTKDASPQEKARIEQERRQIREQMTQARKRFQKDLFLVAVPIGILAIFLGSLTRIQAIGTGLMFGGIFTLVDGYLWYWSELQDWMRFLSLLFAFMVLLYIGYRRLAK